MIFYWFMLSGVIWFVPICSYLYLSNCSFPFLCLWEKPTYIHTFNWMMWNSRKRVIAVCKSLQIQLLEFPWPKIDCHQATLNFVSNLKNQQTPKCFRVESYILCMLPKIPKVQFDVFQLLEIICFVVWLFANSNNPTYAYKK